MERPSQSPPPGQVFQRPESVSSSPVAGGPSDSQVGREGSVLYNFFSKVSSAFGFPFGFFQSRPEIRTWGEEDLQDPSVQPRPADAPADYGTSLPGYPKHTCAYFDSAFGRSKGSPEFVTLFNLLGVQDDKLVGPRLNGFPMCKLDYPSLPPDRLGTPSYDYRDLLGYRMDYHPYVNAAMSPEDPARMYVCANWMVGYPYGVPAVEENEKAWKAMS
ncbi:hypothetical protein, conserved [Eimeria tenella]|uniref:Uncharacterized protein n=1 Tax=Eimeria tenella TaxID=5802 RepID=H9B944_EIMTE|nr:hypothetical protein, conserved [Eimeria tenella]AET50504.1 hypothetical protein [Eimeria tenella]CDJ42544.1 hypothetical protein, conserved [Eimeria tenella]|eukprot:XP_013233294.1 hypothetical protein, conserved [Eimeria tenella]